jgi:uncharacterized repeat protein (TIGR01451 family)
MNTKSRFTSYSFLLAALLALGLAFTPARPVQAATCSVTSNADSGAGSLREKVADNGCDTITFAGDTTIHLQSTLTIDRDVTIDGAGHAVTISGDTNDDGTGDVRVFEVNQKKSLTLQNLTVTKGFAASGDGGAIYNSGTVVANNVTFSDNAAGSNGGAVLNYGGNFSGISPCSLSSSCQEGDLTVTNSTFISNTAWRGGAISNYGGLFSNGGNVTVINSTFSGNSAQYAGAIYNHGSRGWTDGVSWFTGKGGNLTVTNSTFAGSTGWDGATISAYYPQNIDEDHNGTITLNNSIFVRGGSQYANCGITTGRIFYGSNNLADDTSCSVATYSDSIRLGPLGSYGGPTQTIPLLPGSAAIDVGNNSTCTTTDQRGVARPQGINCDAGAYESRGFNFTRSGGDQQSTPVYLAFAQPLQVSLQETGGSGLPGATVTFSGPGAGASTSPQSFTAVTDSSGQAAATATANGTPGAYTVSASLPGLAALSFSLTNQPAATTTSLATAPNPSNFGQAVTLTATVTSPSGTPDGAVTFKDNGTAISGCGVGGAVGLSGGQAACALTTLAVGSHAIIAVYGGDSVYAGSSSNSVAQTVRSVSIIVTSAANSGSGTLRQAMADVAPGGTIIFAGDTSIRLASTLTIERNLTIDGGDHHVIISGDVNGSNTHDTGDVRVFIVNSGVTATLQHLAVTYGYVSGGDGAGIYIYSGASLTLSDSALINNQASTLGGGIANFGTLAVTDSTFSGNFSSYKGGAIYSNGALTVTNGTFAGNIGNGNEGGGVMIDAGTYTITNSIFVKGTGPNCSGATLGSNSLADDTSCGSGHYSTTILLGPLGDYGGSTQTYPLLPGSAAIDAGNSASCPTSDQRGVARVGTCDIGAFESRKFTLGSLTGALQSAVINTDFATPLGLTVTANGSGEPVNGGQVTFTAPASGASAALTGSPAAISGGKASVTAKANGSAGSYNVTASTAGAVPVNFALTNTKAASAASLASSPNPSNYGQAVNFTATVSGGNGTPTGTVAFQDGGMAIGVCSSVALSSGQAICTLTQLAIGSHAITAVYGGNAAYTGSTSSPVAQVVNRATSTTTLTSTPNPSTYGQEVTFTATVSGSYGTPTGSVTFYENLPLSLQQKSQAAEADSSSNVVPLTNGAATFTTSALSAGSHSIIAEYSGDATYLGSTSSAYTQVVRGGNIIVTSSADSGPGSLRQAMADIASGGTITFAGDYTIRLASTLTLDRNLTIDGGDHNVVISGDANGNNVGDTGDVRVFLVNPNVSATLRHLTVIRGYMASGDGGGIYIYGGASLTLSDSSLTNNYAGINGGAIVNFGTLAVTSSTLSSNSAARGGGIYNNNGTLTVTGSTFAGNSGSAFGGGLMNFPGTLSVTNSTFFGNRAPYGGGVYHSGGTFTSTNSIYVKGSSGENCYGVPAGSNNLADDASCGTTASTSILLGPLGAYGGPTQTFPLLPGSAAIDAGASASCPAADQRGVARAGTCDIGAFESRKFILSNPTGTPQSTLVNTDFASPLGLTVTANGSGEPVDGGQVTFTAPASGASAILTGSPATISGGSASVTAKANGTAGSYLVTASTSGAGSASFLLTNTKTASTTSLTSSPNPSTYGQEVTFTATVSGAYGTPTGAVAFQDSGTEISGCSAVALSSGQATCVLTSLASGSHAITAVYSGDATYTGSTSSAYTQTVRGSSIIVTSAADSGPGTLRQAIADLAPGGTITFVGNTSIYLAGPLILNRNVTIDGGTNQVVISGDTGNNGSANTYIFDVPAGISASLHHLTLEKGAGKGSGSYIYGGAIYNSGTLTVTDSTFSSNSVNYWGGGIFNHYVGTLTVTNCTFAGNNALYGGGLYNRGTLTVTDSTFSGNSAGNGGGGISNNTSGTLTVTDSTFSGNSAAQEGGGAIYNLAGSMVVTDSTFSGNSASYGGGVYKYAGTLTVTDSTLSGNSATSGGGVYNYAGPFTSTNSLYANNTGNNCYGLIGSGSNNLADDTSCGVAYYSASILLGPLGNFGGPTQTIPLLPGSAAIEAGASASCSSTDQRGVARVGTCDIGAFESRKFTLGSLTGTPQSTLVNTAFAAPLGLTVSANASGEPVNGGQVTFTAPASGASAIFTGSPATISGGAASVTAKANSTAGAFSVSASTTGASSIDFTLTNTLPTAIVVTSADDSGPGTLRQALADLTPGGTITFAGDTTIYLASPLILSRNVTIDGGDHQVVLSGDTGNDGSANTYIFDVPASVSASLHHLTLEKGAGKTSGSNTIGGAIYNSGTLAVTDSTFSGNSANHWGGGVYNYHGTLTVSNSTFSGNNAAVGGGVYNYQGTLAVTDSTFSGNSANSGGGGVGNNQGTLTVSNSTFSGNSATYGGGVYNNSGPFTSTNSLYANNSGNNCYGAIGSGSNNLVGDTSCGIAASTSILLGPLGSYGGPTQTFPLLPGSAAIDAGTSASCSSTDQRGVARVGTCDIGAFESQGFSLGNPTGSAQSAPLNTAFTNPLGLAVSANASGEPVDGGQVTFTAPATGASTSPAVNLATISSGAVSQPVTANGLSGPYLVTASARGASATLSYALANGKAVATVTLSSSLNPSAYKQRVTFTATVSGGSGTPTGTVTFYENTPGDASAAAVSKDLQATAQAGASSNAVTLVNGVATFTTSSLSVGLHSMLAVYSGNATYDTSTSNIIDQGVSKAPAILTQPVSQTVMEGQTVSFSADAVGYPDMTVQWAVSSDGGKNWANIDGATAIPLTFTASISQNGYQYRVTFSNSLGSVTSNAATLTVQQPPAITQQPQNLTVNAGQTATFSAAASGSPIPTVQWQQSTDQGASWADISGATSTTLSFTASYSLNGYQYRAVFTNSLGSATSDPAILTVNQVTGTASISGLVFNDLNGNKTKNTGEAGLAGWTMQLLNPADGSLIVSTQTDASGNYKFSALSAGKYRVRLAQPLPVGFVQTTQDPADITLTNGQAVTGINFGAVLSADLKVSMTANYNASTKVITYIIIVTNDGPADAVAASLTDVLPSGVSYVSIATSVGTCSGTKTIKCNFGTLTSGSSATVTLQVKRTSTKSISNTASVTSSTFDLDKADNSVKVTVP